MEGHPLAWYADYVLHTSALLAVMAVVELVAGLYTRSRTTVLVGAYALVYFAFICSFEVRNDRTFFPLVPYLAVLAALLLARIDRATGSLGTRARWSVRIGLVALVVASLVQPAWESVRVVQNLQSEDARDVARTWITTHIPRGTRIAYESYAPYLPRRDYVLAWIPRAIDHDIDWYAARGFRYLVLSDGMYGRFFREPERYPEQLAQYRHLFETLPLVQRFAQGGHEVRLYGVPHSVR